MHYFIDGHNLIAQLPNISLEDPHDEAKLVLELRSWAAAKKNRFVTVIFDGGVPGGEWRLVSTRKVKVLFASEDSSADAMLRNRVRKVKDARAYTLVTNDNDVLAAAKKRRMPYIKSSKFARSLLEHQEKQNKGKGEATADSELERSLTEQEVTEWLQLFESEMSQRPVEEVDDTPWGFERSNPGELSANRQSNKEKDNEPQVEPTQIKMGEVELDDSEISEWLEIFGQDGD